MQGKSKSLRLGLLALVVVLIMGALGSLSLARDAFDDDYDDCDQTDRLAAVKGLAVERTDEEDEIRISWDALERSDLGDLGGNVLRARITVIVEGGGIDDARHVALGDTNLVIDKVEFTKDLTVSVALTLSNHVISDIAETEFTSGMPAPTFKTNILANVDKDGPTVPGVGGNPDINDGTILEADGEDYGNFYYLGFNDLFDNWFVNAGSVKTRPTSPRFRVGLRHGDGDVKPGDADFENYRITIEDGNGDLLRYQAQTVSASAIYGKNVIVFGEIEEVAGTDADITSITAEDAGVTVKLPMSNVRLSNQVHKGALDAYYDQSRFATVTDGADEVHTLPGGLAYGNVVAAVVGKNEVTAVTADPDNVPPIVGVEGVDQVFTVPSAGVLYALPPVEYFDFPWDIFEGDGNYTIRAWAENDDGTRISPQASIELGIQQRANRTGTEFQGYDADATDDDDDVFRSFGGEEAAGIGLAVWQLSIQDE